MRLARIFSKEVPKTLETFAFCQKYEQRQFTFGMVANVKFNRLRTLSITYYNNARTLMDCSEEFTFFKDQTSLERISFRGCGGMSWDSAVKFLNEFSGKLIHFDLPNEYRANEINSVSNNKETEAKATKEGSERVCAALAKCKKLETVGLDHRIEDGKSFPLADDFYRNYWSKIITVFPHQLKHLRLCSVALPYMESVWKSLTSLESLDVQFRGAPKDISSLLPNPKLLKKLKIRVSSAQHQGARTITTVINAFLDKCPNLEIVKVEGVRSENVSDIGIYAVYASNMVAFFERNVKHPSLRRFDSKVWFGYSDGIVKAALEKLGDHYWIEATHRGSLYKR